MLSGHIQLTLFQEKLVVSIVALTLLWCACAAEANGFSFQYLGDNYKVLRLHCDGSALLHGGLVTHITIYNATTRKSLAEVKVGSCPIAPESPESINIYTLACLHGKSDPLPVLSIIITNLGLSDPQMFVCNITRLGVAGDITHTAWRITVDKSVLVPLPNARAEESRQKKTEDAVSLVDSSLAVYVMGVVILSLVLGLLTALCYIGMLSLKTRNNPTNLLTRVIPGRPNEDTDQQNEAASESDNGQDAGCERSLMCPQNNFRRPSNHDYGEPWSPTLSAFTDHVGFDFLQTQLSSKLASFSTNFAGFPTTEKLQGSKNHLQKSDSRSQDTLDLESNMNCDELDGRHFRFINSTVIILENRSLGQREFPIDTRFSRGRIFNIVCENVYRENVYRENVYRENVYRENVPYRGWGVAGC